MTTLRGFVSLSIVPLVSILLALLIGAVIIILSSIELEGSLNFLLPIVAYESLLEGATGLSFLNVDDGVVLFALSIAPEKAARTLSKSLAAECPRALARL